VEKAGDEVSINVNLAASQANRINDYSSKLLQLELEKDYVFKATVTDLANNVSREQSFLQLIKRHQSTNLINRNGDYGIG
jgi:hypothetical protein